MTSVSRDVPLNQSFAIDRFVRIADTESRKEPSWVSSSLLRILVASVLEGSAIQGLFSRFLVPVCIRNDKSVEDNPYRFDRSTPQSNCEHHSCLFSLQVLT
jgi:hypothetical protein